MKTLLSLVFSILLVGSSGLAQEIQDIDFETVPEGVSGAGSNITLGADTVVQGEVETTEGVRFSDGSLQTTASNAGSVDSGAQSLSADDGLYSNTIADFTPANSYVEICFKGGNVLFDINAASVSPAGGMCTIGDRGWIIDRLERSLGVVSWSAARAECLKNEMRLPEPFEWQFSCENRVEFGVQDMTDDFEWSTNQTTGLLLSGANGILTVLMGGGGCNFGAVGWIARTDAFAGAHPFRCVR